MELLGIHHVSALTADAPRNVAFYTRALGLRLVKKTVNQDDVASYHLFYGDERGTPGTELTFFDIPHLAPTREGTGAVAEVGLAVSDDASLAWWAERLRDLGVECGEISEEGGRRRLPFRDFEGQRLALVARSPGEPLPGRPWARSPVPPERAVLGLGPLRLRLADVEPSARVLVDVLGFRERGRYRAVDDDGRPAEVLVFATGAGGPGGELHLFARPDRPRERLGRGAVHHVAFRVRDDQDQAEWLSRLEALGFHTSGVVDRYWFRSVYFREPGGVLYELATDGPGFLVDEDFERLGETLALPPRLEPLRSSIEARLRPL
ncbi:MAG: ring-cleaving dioxygenase [Clostridia bacterium]|nr:ring-cleaving dioxygenase [Clostridia bacterium]